MRLRPVRLGESGILIDKRADGTVYAVWLNLNFNAGNSAGARILVARSADGGSLASAHGSAAHWRNCRTVI